MVNVSRVIYTVIAVCDAALFLALGLILPSESQMDGGMLQAVLGGLVWTARVYCAMVFVVSVWYAITGRKISLE